MKEKAVFPLNTNTYSIQKIIELDSNYKFSGYISNTEPTKELTMLGKEIGLHKFKIIDPKNFVEKNIDSVLIADDQGFDSKVVSQLVTELTSLNKEIVIAPHLLHKYKEFLPNQIIYNFKEANTNDLLIDTIPIISVTGTGENLLKLETQEYVNTIFDGYKILNIHSKGTIIDDYFVSFPSELFSNKTAFPTKVQLFRHYLSNILEKNSFDLIVISIPGSLTLSDAYYSELALVVSHAVSIDINIVNLYTNFNVSKNTIEILDQTCKYKLNSDLNIFNIVPMCVRYSEEMLGNRYDYYAVEEITQNEIMDDYITNIKHIDQHVFTLNRNILPEISKEFYLEKLTNNVEII